MLGGHPDELVLSNDELGPGFDCFKLFGEDFGLSNRELQAVRLMAEGNTSEDSARQMGVKAATVRTYLQRAYKKTGAQSSEGLAKMLEERKEADVDGLNDSDIASESLLEKETYEQAHISKCAPGLILLCLFIGLVLIPHISFFGGSSWYVSQACTLVLGLVLVLGGGIFFLFRLFGMAPGWISCLVGGLDSGRLDSSLFLSVFVMLTFFSLVNACVWIALLALSLGFAVVYVAAHCLSKKEKGRVWHEREGGLELFMSAQMVSLLDVSFVCGYVFEDTWRSVTDDFTWWIHVIFLVVLIACLLCLKPRLLLCVVSLAAFIVSVSFFGVGIRIALLVIASAFCLSHVLSGRISISPWLAPCVMVFGLSVLASRWLTDVWWDQVSYESLSAMVHGDNWLVGAIAPAVNLLLVAAACVSLGYLLFLRRASSALDDPKIHTEAVLLYLESRGLSSLESRVLLGIASGKSGPQLAHEFHYSNGSMNESRWNGYRKLGVHNRRELISLLELNGFVVADNVTTGQ